MVSSWIVEQVNKLDPALGQAHLFNDEQNAVRRKEYFVLVTTTRTSELNTVDSRNKEIYVVGSVNTIRLRRYGCERSTEGSLRRKIGEKEKKNKVEEFQLADPASLGSLASKN